MSETLFHIAFDYVMKNEGGLVDHPNDPGGRTIYGISAAVARKRGLKPGAVTLTEAMDIYFEDYWVYWDRISDPRLRIKLFDTGVLMGNRRATKLLQRALLNLGENPGPVDGILGRKTEHALDRVYEDLGTAIVLVKFKYQMVTYFRHLVYRRPSLGVFLRGWINRADKEPPVDINRRMQ